jgi:Holliday junction DNA helicase RuvA
MIASIEGIVSSVLEDSVILVVGGVGLRVFVPLSLCKSIEPHKSLALHTHLVVREDALVLYGFETEEEKNMFNLLLGANGVGPRTALAIISTLSLDQIANAVIQEQADFFSRVPGVGKKTAQGIILHLQGKVEKGKSFSSSPIKEIDADVIAALTGLGYSVVESQAALQMIPKDAPEDLGTRIRLALQYFS